MVDANRNGRPEPRSPSPFDILLITATIRPPADASNLARKDPEQRLRDYLDAFAFYLDQLARGVVDRLIFVDNSDSDLSPIIALAEARGLRDRAEFISYFGLDYPSRYGRTFGEMKLINQAYGLSQTLAEHRETAHVWKVTGRYTVRNLGRIVSNRPGKADLYCNCRSFPRRYTDLYLISWSERGYRGLIDGIAEKLRVDRTTETGEALFYDLLEDAKARINVVPRFNVTPFITGVRGFNNSAFNADTGDLWKYRMRVIARRTAPWLWI